MFFYCMWADEASFVCDVASKAAAIAAATEHTGRAPETVHVMPVGVVAFDVNEDEDGELWFEPVEHLAALAEKFEDAELEDGVPVVLCMSEADDENSNVIRCELEAHGDDVEHRAAGGHRWWGDERDEVA